MRIFISHIHEEASFALVLKDWVESTFAGQCDAFVSSDHDDLPAGVQWLEEIDNALGDSAAVITVCSPASIARPWINFEAGCAWIKRTPIIPICHSGLSRNALPQPLSRFQALDFSKDMPSQLIQALAKQLNVDRLPRINFADMYAELQASIPQPSSQPSEQSPATQPDQLDEVEEKILCLLVELNQRVETDQMAGRLQTKPQKMEYYLDRLTELNYVYVYHNAIYPTTYDISKDGRAYLVSRDLL